MIRGETIPITLDFSGEDVDFTQASDILVTLQQGHIEVNKTPTVDDATTLTISLTQTESLSFKLPSLVSPLEVQVNFLQSGVRYASEITEVRVWKQIYDEVMA